MESGDCWFDFVMEHIAADTKQVGIYISIALSFLFKTILASTDYEAEIDRLIQPCE